MPARISLSWLSTKEGKVLLRLLEKGPEFAIVNLRPGGFASSGIDGPELDDIFVFPEESNLR
jgi:hypothetical protein